MASSPPGTPLLTNSLFGSDYEGDKTQAFPDPESQDIGYMATKPQTFSRMKFSLVIYGVLKQLCLACRPAPPCLVLSNLASRWAGSAKVEDSRATSWALPSPIPVSMPLPVFHPSFKEDAHPRLGSSSTTRGSPSQPSGRCGLAVFPIHLLPHLHHCLGQHQPVMCRFPGPTLAPLQNSSW